MKDFFIGLGITAMYVVPLVLSWYGFYWLLDKGYSITAIVGYFAVLIVSSLFMLSAKESSYHD